MRPLKLELEGFGSYRERTVIDFEGVDLFALTGATGSGKSTILDAIVFALYGSVPRYDDKRAVAPVISQNRTEAKVALEFLVGEDKYVVARVVRRNKGVATTKEARLERNGEPLAANERGVSEAAAHAIGIDFEQFTKCVLLPQGEFARFLHDKPRDRIDLLRRLLGVGLYERIRVRASDQAKVLNDECQRLKGQLLEYSDDLPSRLAGLEQRLTELERLFTWVDEESIEITRIQDEGKELLSQSKGLADAVATLKSLTLPSGLLEISERSRIAAEALAREQETVAQARAVLGEKELAVKRLPSQAALELDIRKVEERDRAKLTLANLELDEDPEIRFREAASRHQVAESELAVAESEVEEARKHSEGFALASKLKPGDPCPVCGGRFEACLQPVSDELAAANARLTSAQQAEKALRESRNRTEVALNVHRQKLGEAKADVARRETDTAGIAPLSDLRAKRDAIGKAIQDQTEAQGVLNRAVERESKARRELDSAKEASMAAEREFHSVRARLLPHGPPELSSDNLTSNWQQLVDWTGQKSKELEVKASTLAAEVSELRARYTSRHAAMLEAIAKAGISVPQGANARDKCLSARDESARDVETCRTRIATREDLELRLKEKDASRAIYGKLADLLKSNKFETWLLNRVFRDICRVASVQLQLLTRGQYSIRVEGDNEFMIVDHANANEIRSVKTLSGGETFLTSLSLALALAEQMKGRSSTAVQLDSLFLDEGFGTLDPETLDTVAAAIDELGSSGRMIGVITHVREFADRLPVRFEVRKGATGSYVEKVVQ
jgi:exonuclease SbcC